MSAAWPLLISGIAARTKKSPTIVRLYQNCTSRMLSIMVKAMPKPIAIATSNIPMVIAARPGCRRTCRRAKEASTGIQTISGAAAILVNQGKDAGNRRITPRITITMPTVPNRTEMNP